MKRVDIYSKIVIALVLALLTSELLVKEVFLGYTPKVRPDLADVMVQKTLGLVNIDNYLALFRRKEDTQIANVPPATNRPPSFIPSIQTQPTTAPQIQIVTPQPPQQTIINELAQAPLRQIVKGVYAKETEDATVTVIEENEIEWQTINYQRADGSVEQIEIPKGVAPPPPGLF